MIDEGFDEIFKGMSEKAYPIVVSEGKSSNDINGDEDGGKSTANKGEYGDGKFSGWPGGYNTLRLFNQIPALLIDSDQNSSGVKDIGANEIGFYNALYWAINNTGWAYRLTRIKNSEMEKRTGRTRQTFYKSRKRLMNMGLIEYYEGGGGYHTEYKIIPLREEITHDGKKYVVNDEGFKARIR